MKQSGRIRKTKARSKSVTTKPITPWSAEYFAIIAEIDASYFVLEQMKERFSNRSPITRMVDTSTGYEEHQLKEAKSIVSRIKELQAMLPADDPHFIKQHKVNDLQSSDTKPAQSDSNAPKRGRNE